MAWHEIEGIFILLFSLDSVGGTKLFYDGSGQAYAILKFSSNQETLPHCLSDFGLDITAAANRQGIGGNPSGVASQRPCNGVPKDRFAIRSIAVGDNDGLQVNNCAMCSSPSAL